MADKSDIQRNIDSSRLITRMAAASGVVSLVMLVLTIVLHSLRGGDVFGLGRIPYALALLFSVGAYFYGTLKTSAALDEEEKALLAKRADTRALNVEEDVRFTARRSFENYCRFAPYVIGVLAVLIVGWLLFRSWGTFSGRAASSLSGKAIHSALIAAVMMLLSVFSGAFFVGQSRTPGFRWLRPAGAWLIAGFAVMAVATVAAICFGNNLVKVDIIAARIIFWIIAVLGVETIISMIIEFYRPRTLKEARPVFESQLLSLFTEPGGVVRNIAQALDYQFGFKVSGTWLYGFLERSFLPVLIVWMALLWGFTSIHEVGPDEFGVKERFGRIVSTKPLRPGIYWTLPWPFGDVRRVSCSELREIVIGEMATKDKTAAEKEQENKDKNKPSQVITWTSAHGGEDENFLVAVPPSKDDAKKEKNDKENVAALSFLRMSIPIQFRVREDGIIKFLYDNDSPIKTLKCISEEVATEYLASVDMEKVMTQGREEAERTMRERIQARADKCELGLEIVSVTITGAHPPVDKVAPAFQEIIGAREQKTTTVLQAETYRDKTLIGAAAEANAIRAEAEAYLATKTTVAKEESKRFNEQLSAYNAMPSMFKLRTFLDFLEKDCKDMRKFVITTKTDSDVFQFNFEAKERLDLIDTDITKLKN